MDKKNISYRTSIEKLEKILQNIESDEMDVDELSKQLKTASELIKLCKLKLRDAEEEIDNVLKDIDE